MRRVYFVFAFLFIFSHLFSQAPKDTIYFSNGTIVIGEILKIKLGVMSFDPDDANDITVQLQKLKTLSAVSRVFRIETIHNKVYYGRLVPHPKTRFVNVIIAGKDTVELSLEDISVLYPFEDSFFERFSGNVGLGYTYTRSSDFGRLNFDSKINYTSKKEELNFSISGIYTITDTSFGRDLEDANMKYNYYLKNGWFATLFVAYQRNTELGLSRRFQQGIGPGNKFITTKHMYAWGRSGLVLNQEESTLGVTTGTLTEIFFQLQFNFFRFTIPKINLDMSQTAYYSLSQKDRFRNGGETNLSWELINDFNINLGFYNNYDSKPPAPATTTFDFGIVFGLSYKF